MTNLIEIKEETEEKENHQYEIRSILHENWLNNDLPEFIKILEKHIWLVVRDMKNKLGFQRYKIETNDIIKLGRMKFWVKIHRGQSGYIPQEEVKEQKLGLID